MIGRSQANAILAAIASGAEPERRDELTAAVNQLLGDPDPLEIVWSEEISAYNLVEDGIGICWSKSTNVLNRIRRALLRPVAWFVSYEIEMKQHDGTLKYFPNQRIVKVHPLVWFAERMEQTEEQIQRKGRNNPIVLISWQPLSVAELARNSQIIVEE